MNISRMSFIAHRFYCGDNSTTITVNYNSDKCQTGNEISYTNVDHLCNKIWNGNDYIYKRGPYCMPQSSVGFGELLTKYNANFMMLVNFCK